MPIGKDFKKFGHSRKESTALGARRGGSSAYRYKLPFDGLLLRMAERVVHDKQPPRKMKYSTYKGRSLSDDKIREIRAESKTKSVEVLAKEYGVSTRVVKNILDGVCGAKVF